MSMVLAACMVGSVACGAATDGWQAGVSRVDITPGEPIWLAGYASRDHAFEGKLHPLWVKALALQDAQGKRAVLVTSDLLGFPKDMSDRIRDRLKSKLQLERAQIILNSSHTHSAPVIGKSLLGMYHLIDEAGHEKIQRYSAKLEDQVVASVEEAFGALQPVQLASANGVTRFAVNRRNNTERKIAATHDLNGPVDHAVPVIRVTGADGKPLAVVFGYACHCTTLSAYQVSGDYAGFAQVALEEALPGCNAMFFAGCGANQNPLPRRTVALATQYGKELAASVERVLAETMKPLEASMATAYQEKELLLQEPISRDKLESIVKTGSPYLRGCAQALLDELDAGRALRTSYPYPVVMWKLGAQAIVALGGEVVVDYAIFIKNMLGHDAFVMGYSNDFMSYIPSVVVLEEGGYEGDTSQMLFGMPSKWQPNIEERVLTAVRELAVEVGTPTAGK
jgi:neutral/alkaline ceramidase-like enzyme